MHNSLIQLRLHLMSGLHRFLDDAEQIHTLRLLLDGENASEVAEKPLEIVRRSIDQTPIQREPHPKLIGSSQVEVSYDEPPARLQTLVQGTRAHLSDGIAEVIEESRRIDQVEIALLQAAGNYILDCLVNEIQLDRAVRHLEDLNQFLVCMLQSIEI